MKLFKKNFYIAMTIILSLFLANCSSSDDKLLDDDDDLQLTAPHTYDIKLTRGDETHHYTGSITDEDNALTMIIEGKDEEGKDTKHLSLIIDDGPLKIIGSFIFDKNGALSPFDFEEDRDEFSSGISITDTDAGFYFASMNGKPVLSNLKNHYTAQSQGVEVSLISYTLKFNGDFQNANSENDVLDVYSVTGTIVMSPYR